MADYGYSIEHILMVDIIPDAAVRKAMNDINAGTLLFQLSITCTVSRLYSMVNVLSDYAWSENFLLPSFFSLLFFSLCSCIVLLFWYLICTFHTYVFYAHVVMLGVSTP
jgi:hypothetical protein